VSLAARTARVLPWALGGVAAVVLVTWVLEQVMPPPYSGYLALVLVGLVATEIVKRQPRQRALRMFRIYLRARERGAAEAAARERLLERVRPARRGRAEVAVETAAAWTGASERDRVVSGVGYLLAREGRALGAPDLGAAYDRARDRVMIAGWEALPPGFTDAVLDRLEPREREDLDGLVARYRLFDQKFFRSPSALGADPAAGAADFARLLHSLGNRMAGEHPGDAERAYRLSLRIRPELNLAHAGLALLLDRTGRTREAAGEAQVALEVLDRYATRPRDEAPTVEDISPFRTPASLRQALDRVRAGAEA
jgi:hypothetical protein